MRSFIIPNLCRNSNVLLTMVVTELAIVVIWLLSFQNSQWQSFGLWSFYGQWLVLTCCLALCLSRHWIGRQTPFIGYTVSVLICLSVLIIVEILSTYVMTGVIFDFSLNWSRYWRIGLASSIIIFAILRFFSLLTTIEQRNNAEVKSRIQALQSRIQPHFLFNCLNSIAELTATDAIKAEKAIHALSMLFRVSLEEGENTHSLERELSLCNRYLELEDFRLGSLFKIQWNIDVQSVNNWQVPKLILQPIIENAIKYSPRHDIEGNHLNIIVDIKESKKFISIMVLNPVADTIDDQSGSGLAIKNIKERLFVMYDDQYTFRAGKVGDNYRVIIQIPKNNSSL